MEQLIIGKVYKIRHDRKGTFIARLDAIDDEWLDVTLLEGAINSASNPNEVGSYEIGGSLRCRRSLSNLAGMEE